MKNTNKNKITELVFILDRSGSMAGLESDTIGGFNSMIEKQKKQDGGCYVSTVIFDDESEVLHDRVKLHDIPKMTDKDYTVRGCTALIDAIGGAIHHIGKGINDVLMKSNAISRNLRLNNKKSINIVFHFDMIRVSRVFLRKNYAIFDMIFFCKNSF